jgi:hypothetical protein
MSNVLAFKPSLLKPFLGTWVRDPLSISRNKVVKSKLGTDGLKLLWNCHPIEDVRQCLRDNGELAANYEALRGVGCESRVVISSRVITWIDEETTYRPAKTVSSPITGVSLDGRKVIVNASSGRTVSGYELRFKQSWLLVSERYSGRNALLFPKSPVFRYYREAPANPH